jgi:hypothetical protein
MTAKAIDLEIFGLAAQENERAPFRAAARQLAAWLMTASGAQPNILLTLADDVTALAPATVPRVVIISLISELSSGEMEFADLIKKYRNKCSALASLDSQSVFVCTIFRHIPQQQGPSAAKSRTWMQERIARLNLLTAELSQATGIYVIDIDRIFAHFGARNLQTDYLISGPRAVEVAGDVIAGAMLSDGLDHAFRPEWLERARHLRGGLPGLMERFKALPPG